MTSQKNEPTGNHANGATPVPVVRSLPEFGVPAVTQAGPTMSPQALVSFWAGILNRHKWSTAGIFVAVCALGLPAVWLTCKPLYRASATCQVDPVISRIVFKNEEKSLPGYDRYLNTQVSIILSPTILQRALDQSKVQQTQWYREQELPEIHEHLRRELQVRPLPKTELIEIAMVAGSPDDAKAIADAVVEQFNAYYVEASDQSDLDRFQELKNELDLLQESIDGLVASKSALTQDLGVPEELRAQRTARISALESEYEDLKRQHALSKRDLESAGHTDAISEPVSRDATAPAPTHELKGSELAAFDAEWIRLNGALANAKASLAIARQKFGAAHPQLRLLNFEKQLLEQQIAERETQLDEFPRNTPDSTVDQAVEPAPVVPQGPNLQAVVKRQEYGLQLLQEELDKQREELKKLGRISATIAQLDEEIRHKHELYQAVRARYQELEMEDKAPPRISIASRATTSTKPHRDRRSLFSVAVCGMAMVLSLGVLYLRANLDSRVNAAHQIQCAVQAPVLGQLPALPEVRDPVRESDPMLHEGIRLLRTSVLASIREHNHQVLLLTSCYPSIGKSTIALLLARSVAALDKKVLLIEADLRRPTMAKRLDGDPEGVGLVDLLTDRATDGTAIQRGQVQDVDVVVAGDIPEDFNYELLANGRFADCLSRWKSAYDVVLVDSPPVLSVADARVMAHLMDGAIMIARFNHCRRQDLSRASDDLNKAGTKVLGAVMVDVRGGLDYSPYYSGTDTEA